jgi:hypothetical protein
MTVRLIRVRRSVSQWSRLRIIVLRIPAYAHRISRRYGIRHTEVPVGNREKQRTFARSCEMRIPPFGISFVLLFASAMTVAACSGGANDAAEGEFAPSEESSDQGDSTSPIVGGVRASSYQEAALIDMYQSGYLSAFCSGAVIAPRVVLTAGHCVDGISSWQVTTPFAGNQSSVSIGGKVYDWRSRGETVDPNVHDIGLIFLKDPIRLTTYPVISTTPVASGTKAINVGRIQDGRISRSSLFEGRPITLQDGRRAGFPFDYESTEVIQSGDSGGPVFLAGQSTHTIIAVNSGGGGGSQVLARTDLLASWIAQQIAANGGGGSTGGSSTGGGSTGGGPTSGGSTGGSSTGGASTGGGSTSGGSTGGGTCTPVSGRNDSYTRADVISRTPQTFCGKLAQGDSESWFTFNLASGRASYDVRVKGSDDAALGLWKETDTGFRRIANTTDQMVSRTSTLGGKYVAAAYSPSATPQSFTLSFSATR